MRVYAVGLVVVALVYLAFALNGGGSGWLIVELLGLAIFTVSAWLGVKVSAFFLGVGWALHAAWDGLMLAIPSAGFVPIWYPPACLAFDLVLAGYIFVIRKRLCPI